MLMCYSLLALFTDVAVAAEEKRIALLYIYRLIDRYSIRHIIPNSKTEQEEPKKTETN